MPETTKPGVVPTNRKDWRSLAMTKSNVSIDGMPYCASSKTHSAEPIPSASTGTAQVNVSVTAPNGLKVVRFAS